MALCRITGVVYTPDGNVAGSRFVTFVRDVGETVQSGYLGAISPDPVRTRTDVDGTIDISLITGYYYGFVESHGRKREYRFRVGVPDDVTADFSDILDITSGVVDVPAWLQQAFEARDDAQDYAAQAAEAELAAEAAAEEAEQWAETIDPEVLTRFVQAGVGAKPRTNQDKLREVQLSPRDFGSFGDGDSHKLVDYYSTLSEAQADFPWLTSLDPDMEMDHAGIQQAMWVSHNNHTGTHPVVVIGAGRYLVGGLQGYNHVRVEGVGEGTHHSTLGLSHGYQTELIQLPGTNKPIFLYDVNSTTDPDKNDDGSIGDVSVSKMQIRGAWVGIGDTVNTFGPAIQFTGVRPIQGCHFEDLYLRNLASSAIMGDRFPLPGIFERIWCTYVNGFALDFNATGDPTRGTQMFLADLVQGDFMVGGLIRIDAAARSGSDAGSTYMFSNLKHEIDSSATSATAYGKDTIVLNDLDRASVIVSNANPQPSNPLGGGIPETNSVLKLTGTKRPYVHVMGSRMGSGNNYPDYLIDDQTTGRKISKRNRGSRYLDPVHDVIVGHSETTIMEETLRLNDDTLVIDAFSRFKRDVSGAFFWGPGNTDVDTNLKRLAKNRLGTDNAFQAKRLLARGGVGLAAGDFTLNGWGTGASVVVDASSGQDNNDQRFRIVITAGTEAFWNKPTFTVTFKDSVLDGQKWVTPPKASVCMGTESTGAISHVTAGPPGINNRVFTYQGTPEAGNTYIFECMFIG